MKSYNDFEAILDDIEDLFEARRFQGACELISRARDAIDTDFASRASSRRDLQLFELLYEAQKLK